MGSDALPSPQLSTPTMPKPASATAAALTSASPLDVPLPLPPSSLSLVHPSIARDNSSQHDVSPDEVLWQLLREWRSGVAELLLGEAAAADVMGYANTPHLRACECAGEDAECCGCKVNVAAYTTVSADAASSPLPEDGDVLARLLKSLRLPVAHLLPALHSGGDTPLGDGPTERLIARLAHYVPSLQPHTDAASASSPSPSSAVEMPFSTTTTTITPEPAEPPTRRQTLAMPVFDSDTEVSISTGEQPSPSRSMPTAAPTSAPHPIPFPAAESLASNGPSSWSTSLLLLRLADVVQAAMDGFDSVIDTVFATHDDVPCSPRAVTTTTATTTTTTRADVASCSSAANLVDAVAPTAGDAAEESCIVAGLLLSCHVRLRSGPAYRGVVAPLLVALDLDLTVLRRPLSSLSFRAVTSMTPSEVRDVFIDAAFFRRFCEALTQRGHVVAICSLTEGVADQSTCGATVAEVVLRLVSAVLPLTRTYLASAQDVVCLPKSMAGPGKQFHLQVLQQRRNAHDASASFTADVSNSSNSASASSGHYAARDVSCMSHHHPHHPFRVRGSCRPHVAAAEEEEGEPHQQQQCDEDNCGGGFDVAVAPLPLLPRWLSTDVLLIDDDKENCRLAVVQGYHAAHCAATGLSAAWYAARPDVQVLLGLTAEEVAHT